MAYLDIGDAVPFDNRSGVVVAVTDTTTSDGRGSVEFSEHTFYFRALKGTVEGVDHALVATGDAVFRVGLVRQDQDPELYCLVCDDGPAPGWGRRVQGLPSWATAGEWGTVDSCVFRMGWAPGPVYLKKGGANVGAGVYADLVFRYVTSDSTHEAWWQPAYPSKAGTTWGADTGRFKTDDDGRLWDYSSGEKQPIIVPRGFASLGFRTQDAWPSCEAERVLSRLNVWYLQEHAELAEGIGAMLNAAAVEITVTGPASAVCQLIWNGCRNEAPLLFNLGVGGSATATGLPPGDYTAVVYHATDWSMGLPRQKVEATTSGGSYTVTFASSFTHYPTPKSITVQAYHHETDPLGGASVYGSRSAIGYTWELLGETDANGVFTYLDEGRYRIKDWAIFDARGAARCGVGRNLTDGIYWDPAVSAYFGGVYSKNAPLNPQGIVLWGAGGDHVNLPTPPMSGYMRDVVTDEKWWFQPAPGSGVRAGPCPRWLKDDTAVRGYMWEEADGTPVTGAAATLVSDPTPPWVIGDKTPAGWVHHTTVGTRLAHAVGGKIHGNIVEASRGDRITTGNLPEASRMGLELGRYRPLEVRSHSQALADAGATSWPTTFLALECPYCGGPAWAGPDGTYKRGYCIPCLAAGYTVDARTFFLTQTIGTHPDYSTRCVSNTTAGAHADRLIASWVRPQEYFESDPYIQTYIDGLQRWVAVHIGTLAGIGFGTLADGVFTDGESVADAEARLNTTIGPTMVKLELLAQYLGTGKTVSVTLTRADNGLSQVLTASVPPGSPAGTVILLNWGPHDAWPGPWYTDVTAAAEVSGTGYLACRIVNDAGSYRSPTGTIVTPGTSAPFCCDVLLALREPWLAEDFMGLLHLAWCRQGTVALATRHWGADAFQELSWPLRRAGYYGDARRPCLGFRSGAWLLSATCGADTRLFMSRCGATNRRDWQPWATLAGVSLASWQITKMGVVHLVGLEGGQAVYTWSDDEGLTWRPRTTVGYADNVPPAVSIDGSGCIHVAFSQSGNSKVAISRTLGTVWEFPAREADMASAGLSNVQVAGWWAGQWLIGNRGGHTFLRRSETHGASADPLVDGTREHQITSESTLTENPGLLRDRSGGLWAALGTVDAVKVYHDRTGGCDWEHFQTLAVE